MKANKENLQDSKNNLSTAFSPCSYLVLKEPRGFFCSTSFRLISFTLPTAAEVVEGAEQLVN